MTGDRGKFYQLPITNHHMPNGRLPPTPIINHQLPITKNHVFNCH
ncbi:hypothetical protein [Trichormus sp. NMC-1]|nr:hypothetical protein [Trichormus sp. NMC-1]